MSTIKSFTSLEQSKKLAKILPLESADMYLYLATKGNPKAMFNEGYNEYGDFELPCWSLASLLGVLKDYTLQTNTDGTVFVVCESKKPIISDFYNNPVDACVAMILKLNELNLL